jgi:biopolymer transport protein ExbD
MKFKRRKIKRGRVEIIPMIDTIVILLIFYMTFSRFAEAQRANVVLPKSRHGDELAEKGKVVINMRSAEDVIIEKQHHKIEDVPAILRRIKANAPAGENISVILRADKGMKYRDLSDFMRALGKAQIPDVTFATTE